MALTTKQLDTMQTELLRIFESASGYSGNHPEQCKAAIMAVQTILAIENERRLSDEYKPRTSITKD